MSENLSALFLRFRDRNDMRALARVFDQTAPELASVAAHLAKSAPDAEDLVQATFLAAIESAASFDERRPLVPWLLGILSMQARRQRQQSNRALDPQRVHQPDPAAPEADVQAREITDAVDAAVSQLDGRYAGLVRRHLLDGAPPAELAREFELSSITTRVRLHRGMKQLRKLLPASMAGTAFGASLWRVDIAAIRGRVLRRAAELSGASVPVASLASTGLMIALLVPLAVATPAWLLWRSRTTSEASAVVGLIPAASRAEPAALSHSAITASAVEAVTEPEPALRLAANQAVPPNADFSMVGRLLLPNGSAAAGASVRFHGWPGGSGPDQGNLESANWIDPEPVSVAADGRFEFRLHPLPGLQYALEVDAPSCAHASWRWYDSNAGLPRDLGDVRLESSGSALVRIVNEQGEPQFLGWTVNAEAAAPNSILGRDTVMYPTDGDAQDSSFTIDRLPARRVTFFATHASGAWSEKQTVQMVAGSRTPIDLVYRGSDLRRQITIRVGGPNSLPGTLAAEHVWIERAGSSAREASRAHSNSQSYAVADLEPGSYSARIENSRMEPWSHGNVQPGETVIAKVKGNAGLRLRILDADQALYNGRYQLSVKRFGTSMTGGLKPLVAANVDPPEDGRVSGIWPGDYELELRIAGRAPKQFVVAGLQPFETRDVEVLFSTDSAIQGRVFAHDGATTLAGVDVQLTQGALAGHMLGNLPIHRDSVEIPPVLKHATTDANGNYHFDGLQSGPWTVHVAWSRWLSADRTLTLPDSSSVDFAQPACGYFSGRLLLPEGAQIERMVIDVAVLPIGTVPWLPRFAPEPGELAADGSFKLGPIPVGSVDVTLMVFSHTNDGLGDGDIGTGPRIGEFQIVEGESAPVEIDARSIIPAHLQGTIRMDGALVNSGNLLAIPLQDPAGSLIIRSVVTEDGRYSVGGLKPGVELSVTYTALDGWSWTSPQRVTLAAGSDMEIPLAFETIEREIQILDAATHLPVANQRLGWRTGQDFGASTDDPWSLSRATSKSDAQGKLRLRLPSGPARPVALPPGKLTAANLSAGSFTPASIDWAAGNTPVVLYLTPR